MTTGFSVFIVAVLEVALDAIQLVDQVQRDISTTRLAFGLHFLCVNELAPCMSPTP